MVKPKEKVKATERSINFPFGLAKNYENCRRTSFIMPRVSRRGKNGILQGFVSTILREHSSGIATKVVGGNPDTAFVLRSVFGLYFGLKVVIKVL